MPGWSPLYPSMRSAVATISDQTIYFGAETENNAGGAKAVDSLGNEVDITAVSGSTGWSVSGGRIIRSSAPNNGAVLSCTTALGTINVTISTIANGISVASISEIQTIINKARPATNPGGYTTALAGKTMYVRPGSYDTRDNHYGVAGFRGTMEYRNAFLNQTGLFTIRPHGPQWSSVFNFWRLWIPDYGGVSDRSGDIYFKDIAFFRSMESFKTDIQGGVQDSAATIFRHEYGKARNLTFDGCKFYSDMQPGRTGAFKNYSHYPIALLLENVTNGTIKNCLITQVGSGIRSLSGDGWVVDNNEYSYSLFDFCNIGATNFRISNNVIHNFVSDGVYHPDFMQGYTLGSGPGIVEGNIIYPGYETPRGLRGSSATTLDYNRLERGGYVNVINSDRTITCDGVNYPEDTNGKTISQQSVPANTTTEAYTLPQLSAMPSGYTVSFCKRNGSAVSMVISPYSGDTINSGAVPSVTLDEFYESVRFVKQSSTNWTMTMDDAQNGPVRKFSNFTMTSSDAWRVFHVDASAGNVTVTLPQATTLTTNDEFEIHKFDTSANTVTIVPHAGDTYLDQDGTNQSAGIVLRHIGRMRGFKAVGTSRWTITTYGGTGEPQGMLMQSTGGEQYSDITVRGNLWWFAAGHTVTFESSPANTSNIKIYNNTFVSPLVGDIDGDGLLHKPSDGVGTNAPPTATGQNRNTFVARNICSTPSTNLALDNITSVAALTPSTYSDYFVGDDTDVDFMPLTRQQAIEMARPRSAANVKYGAVGTTDENGYWNFTTKQANTGFGDAPTILSTVPVDGSLSMPDNYNIVINFSQPVEKGTGNIVLRQNNSGWSDVETFDAASSARLTWDGNKLTIDPTSNLTAGREYAVRIASTAVKSQLYSTYFAGIANDTTFSFTAITAPSQNLLTGSNSFDGSDVWELFQGTGSTTLTATANTETGEPYSRLSSTASNPYWRYDSSLAEDANWTPAGSTAYTFTIYVKKDTSAFDLSMYFRTLGGTDQSVTVAVNTGTWALTDDGGALKSTAGWTWTKTLVATDEYRLRVTFTTSASTSRILWELRMPSGTNNVLVSSSKVSTAGLDAYSPGY